MFSWKKPFNRNKKEPHFNENMTRGREEIIFYNPQKKIKKTIVEKTGKILNYPGIAHPKLLEPYYEGKDVENISPYVRYMSEFHAYHDGFIMIWRLQPDGRYWEDEDGFGAEPDVEIRLYSLLDDQGNFISPFRIYNIGFMGDCWIETDREEEKLRELEERERADALAKASGKTVEEQLYERIEWAVGKFRENDWPCKTEFLIPESHCKALLFMEKFSPEDCSLGAGVVKGDSDRMVSNDIKYGTEDALRKQLTNPELINHTLSRILHLKEKEENR